MADAKGSLTGRIADADDRRIHPAFGFELLARISATAAPAGVLVGWILMRWSGHRGPGTGWTLAHSVWIASYALFIPLIVALYRRRPTPRTPRPFAAAITATALIGTAALLGQMLVDLVVGLVAADRSDMNNRFEQAFHIPGVRLALYEIGPALFTTGLVVLFVYLAVLRQISPSTAVLAGLGLTLTAAEHAAGSLRLVLMPIGILCVWLALTRTIRQSAKLPE